MKINSQFQHIGIVIRPQTPHLAELVGALAGFLLENGIEVSLDEATQDELSHLTIFSQCHLLDKKKMGRKCDLVISMGGDGTLLSIARKVAPYRVPLIGVHRGTLGFLTQVPSSDAVAQVAAMITGKYTVEERIMLEISVLRDDEEIEHALALNDAAFNRGGTGQMIEFEVFINKEFVYRQRSDGLIVATPTGSTAYSLAAGGAILQPSLRAFTLVPICPQSMNNRPIAVADTGEIEVLLTHGNARVYFDGQSYCDLQKFDRVIIRRYRNSVRMLQPADYKYFATLRHKLHWSEQLV